MAVLPGLAEHGGIQRHNRTLCRALSSYVTERGGQLDVVALQDPDGFFDPAFLTQPVRGGGGNRYRFAVHAGLALAQPCDLLILGVVDFAVFLALPYCLRRKQPVLTVTHGVEVWKRLPLHQRPALRRADRVFAVSHDTMRRLVTTQGVPAEKVVVVPTPIDPAFVVAAGQAEVSPKYVSELLTVSRMSVHDYNKRIDQVISCLPELQQDFGLLRYVIVGAGDDQARLAQLASSLGVGGSVRFTGHVTDDELHSYLSSTEIFVLPSAKEGFGIVFLEAMAHGRPVVGGNAGGTPEVVLQGVTGLLVDPSEREQLLVALRRLLGDREYREQLGATAQTLLHSRFTYEYFRIEVEGLVDSMLLGDTP